MNNLSKGGAKPSVKSIYDAMMAQVNPRYVTKGQEPEKLSDYALMNRVYNKACQFLDKKRFVNAGVDLMNNDSFIGVESFNAQANLSTMQDEDMDDLVESADIPEEDKPVAKASLCLLFSKLKSCAGNNSLFRTMHFNSSVTDNAVKSAIANDATVIYAPSLQGMYNNFGMPGQEAFGADIDKVIPDIRTTTAITLLQFHRGFLDRVVHRRVTADPHVVIVVPRAEVYDMLKSNDASSAVRDEGDHIVPFIDLYADPKSVSNQLQKIIPLAANDTQNVVLADGFVRFNHDINLFDLSKLANQLGKSQYNYTDPVSENVIFDSVIVKLTKGNASEMFQINVNRLDGARFNMKPNTSDSGDRATMFHYVAKLGKDTKTTTGADSAILASCTETDFIRLELHVSSQISLKTSKIYTSCQVAATGYNRSHGPVAAAVTALLNDLTIVPEAYAVDARYSEENLRKSNLAIRYHTRLFNFEISNGRNILVDYSMNEELPEFLMSLVTEATSLGQDHKGLDIIIRELLYVYDRANLENENPEFRARLDKIGFQYVSSQIVRPAVYINSIDLSKVDTIRSSDILGDIRQYVEWELMNLVSLLYQNTYYKHQLNPGEIPVFKVGTSSVILENLFNIPHIHDHLNHDTKSGDAAVEYRRVLPNGTVLDMVTITYDNMRDKIFMIPWREELPEDILNFGQNFDCGTFVAHYNPQIDNAVNKRVFSNSKSMVIPFNPMGLYLDVKHLDEFIDMFQLINYDPQKASILAQPSDLWVKE